MYLHHKKYFVVCGLDASIFMPNSNTEAAVVQEAPCSFSSGSERGVKGHGSPFCMFPKIGAKSSGASRSNGTISPPLVGNDVCDRRLCNCDRYT